MASAAAGLRLSLFVTTGFRRENGAWKMVHRHEGPLVTKTAPGAVIQ